MTLSWSERVDPCEIVEYLIYLYIHTSIDVLLLTKLSIHLSGFHNKSYILSKVSIAALESRDPLEPVVASHLAVPAHQTLRGRIPQRKHVRKPHTIPCVFVICCSAFHNLTETFILAMVLVDHQHVIKGCDSTQFINMSLNQI